MTRFVRRHRRGLTGFALVGTTTLMQLGFLGSCDSRLIEFTEFFDPCGTVFANCTPGSFQANAADIGDFCIDPVCTIPGGCDQDGPPIGTQRDICP